MGDLGDYWREHKEHKRKVKDRMREAIPKAIALLDDHEIPYRVMDSRMEHYRVDERYDWWPSTGYWKEIRGNRKGYRVRRLIQAVESDRIKEGR